MSSASLDSEADSRILASALSHFHSIPWTSALLSAPGVVPFISWGRSASAASMSSGEKFFGHTLNSPDTIPYTLSFYAHPPPLSPPSATNPSIPRTSPASNSSNSAGAPAYITRATSLHTLQAGLDGFPGAAHGGLLTTLLDEGMGVLLEANMRRFTSTHPVWKMSAMLTAGLEVRFRRKVEVPSVVAVVAEIAKIEGRKIEMRARVVDAGGSVLVEGTGWWVGIPGEKL